ncbi:YqaJ viral recombinase family protein [Alicyclobacillus macrosporangiidus]|jgi:putative phage-type endonuclease|uniref:Putative phage-type endonuclease n=1 Tax=Alicyclobacillus macrosporangiidus TaxID=392015 RepID=A0A1I7FU42_9BACL|nr:YqaJ viral recombinase family protein [Alicyclobacillus macrosporangiidus]SFU39526.1 putative phage-type endonuclease [Alicyclobacillus macrosporangiidus]
MAIARAEASLRRDRYTSALVLIDTSRLSRDEWLAWRRLGIGGSDAAAVAGISPWKSPTSLYLEKLGAAEPEEAGEAAYWGTLQEPLVAKEFKERTGYLVRRRNAMLRHPEHDFMIADIDRLVHIPGRGWGVLEVKCTGARHSGDWEDDKVPDHYMLQLQHYLAVTGLEFGFFAVLIGGQKYHQVEVERDDQLIDYLVQIEKDFWHCVETRTPPELDGSISSVNVLDYLYPPEKTNPDEVQLPEDMEFWIQQYIEACGDIKEAEERKQRAANELKAYLGDREVGRHGLHKVSWKAVRTERFDTKAFQAAHPELFKQFLKTSVTRRFTIS